MKSASSISFRRKSGFITIELLMAFVIGTLFLSAALMLTLGIPGADTRYNLETGSETVLDTTTDQEVHRELLHRHDLFAQSKVFVSLPSDFVTLTDQTSYTQDTHYISPCSALLISEATSLRTHERTWESRIAHVVSNPRIARAFGNGSCDPLPPSTWRSPTRSPGETPPLALLGTPTSFSYGRIDGTPYLFVSTANSIQSNDLWVISLEDPYSPQVISSLETGDDTHTTGLLDVASVTGTDGSFVYALQNSGTNQLVVVDVSDPSTPLLVHTESFEPYGVNPSGSNPEGRVIVQYDHRLYVGLRTTIGPEFLVFDIEEDPRNPLFVGALPSSFDHSIYDIALSSDGFAFLAIKPGNPPSGIPTRELMTIDIRTLPRDTGGGWNATNTPHDTEGAMSLFLIGNRLYLGRERVSNALERDFYVLNVSSSTKPTYLKSRRLGIPTTSLQGTPRILDVVVQGNLAFLATTDPTKSFQVYDVTEREDSIIPVVDNCRESVSIPRLTKLFYYNNTVYTLFGLTGQVESLTDTAPLCS